MNSHLILLVDDEQEIVDIYSQKLIQAGFEVITAGDGAECIKLAKEKHPELILLDVKMPDMDGVEAFYQLKKGADTQNIKVVFLTAFTDPHSPDIDIKLSKEIGADFIRKGVSLNEFVDTVKSFFKKDAAG